MRHIFSVVCIGLIIWLASDKIAATYPRELIRRVTGGRAS
jgi:hypothetical protein